MAAGKSPRRYWLTLRPTLSKDFHHFIIAIFLLLQFQMERTFNQLSLMIQQPLSADDNGTVIPTMEARYRDVQRILIATQWLGSDNPARKLAAQICHQRIAQLLIQRAGPQVIVGDGVLYIAGLVDHPVAGQ